MVDNEGILAWPVPVQNVTFHPDYRTYSMAINNLAVIRVSQIDVTKNVSQQDFFSLAHSSRTNSAITIQEFRK